MAAILSVSATTARNACSLRRHVPRSAQRPLAPGALARRAQQPRVAAFRRSHALSVRAGSSSTSKEIERMGDLFQFYKVEATIRKWRVPYVTEALSNTGIRGLTQYDVSGIGFQQGIGEERNKGSQFGEQDFVEKSKIEIIVVKDQVDVVIDTILDSCATGEIGDGKIFVLPVLDVIRVRTGERGTAAERMQGGFSDMTQLGSVTAKL